MDLFLRSKVYIEVEILCHSPQEPYLNKVEYALREKEYYFLAEGLLPFTPLID